ncbi:MAG: hypothetical protein SFU83_06485 [Meiothermus sp.]|nr:hypothetical protein [Meiothermus sp.]
MLFGFGTKPGWCGLPLSLAVVLLFAQLVLAQGAPDPCASRVGYDQARAVADAADEASKKLVEPDWDKLPSSLRSEFQPHILVEAPGTPVREKRVQNLLRELKSDLQALKKNLRTEEFTSEYINSNKRYLNSLQRLLADLKKEIEVVDQDLSMPQGEAQKFMKLIADSEHTITQLVGNRDIAVAKWRPGDPKFKDFKSPEIARRQLALNEAESAEEKKKAELALNQAIERTRQEAIKAVATLDLATEALIKLGWVSQEGERLVRRKSHMQRELIKLEADTTKQERKLQDISDAIKISEIIGEIEPWLNTRLKSVQAEEKLEQARGDYDTAIKVKDNLLNREKNRFNQEQARINQVRTSLQGRVKDQLYYQQLSRMTLHARATYELILINLSDLDCFGEVRTFMDDIKRRIKNLDTLRDQILKEASAAAQTAAARPVPVRGTFVRTQVVLGKVPGSGERNDNRFYGSVSATSFSFTVEMKPPYVGKANVSHSWNTPPSALKPGDILELTCSSTASKSGVDAPNLASGCFWVVEGRVELVEPAVKAFAGTASDGKFYPQSKGSIKLRILPSQGTNNTITITATHGGPWWQDASKEVPAIYKYKFNP